MARVRGHDLCSPCTRRVPRLGESGVFGVFPRLMESITYGFSASLLVRSPPPLQSPRGVRSPLTAASLRESSSYERRGPPGAQSVADTTNSIVLTFASHTPYEFECFFFPLREFPLRFVSRNGFGGSGLQTVVSGLPETKKIGTANSPLTTPAATAIFDQNGFSTT
jgi:hypothetical protein